jgi:hypothetical protein
VAHLVRQVLHFTYPQARLVMEAGIRGSAQVLAERLLTSALVCTTSPLAHHGPVGDATEIYSRM